MIVLGNIYLEYVGVQLAIEIHIGPSPSLHTMYFFYDNAVCMASVKFAGKVACVCLLVFAMCMFFLICIVCIAINPFQSLPQLPGPAVPCWHPSQPLPQ